MVTNFIDNEPRLNAIAHSIRSKIGRRNRDAIAIGLELIEAKEITGHGYWEAWLAQEFQWSVRTAQNYMSAARQYGDRALETSARNLYLLAAPSTPEEAKHEIIDLIEQGKNITNAEAKKIADKYRDKETVTVIAEESPYYRQSFRVIKRSGGMIEAEDSDGNRIGLLKHWVEPSKEKKQKLPQTQHQDPLAELSDYNQWLVNRVRLLEDFIFQATKELSEIAPDWVKKARQLIDSRER